MGLNEGAKEGRNVPFFAEFSIFQDGRMVGCLVGWRVGCRVGCRVGRRVGCRVGCEEGWVGLLEGCMVG